MEDLIGEKKVRWEQEQKKSKKALHKNWKVYASALGIIIIGAGLGLGIYYGVTANQGPKGITSQQIVDEINNKSYKLDGVEINTAAEQVKTKINAEFFKQKLSKEFQDAFKDNLFSVGDIMVQTTTQQEEHVLNDSDLRVVGTINAKIGYTYDKIKGADLTLTITVIHTITDQEIADALASATYNFDLDKSLGAEKAQEEINTLFFTKKLTDQELLGAFKEEKLTHSKIMVGDKELKDEDLVVGDLATKITFTYGEAETQTITLTITVIHTITDQEIADALASATYNFDLDKSLGAEKAQEEINTSFFTKKLTDQELLGAFKEEKLTHSKIMVGDRKLKDEDLVVGDLATKITFTYGEAKAQTITLTITVVEHTITDKNISENITNGTYSEEVTVNTTAKEVNAIINKDLFKINLTPEMKAVFHEEKLEYGSIMIGDKELKDEDLQELKEFNTTIPYTYGEAEAQTITYTITVVAPTISDQEISDAIASRVYSFAFDNSLPAEQAQEKINPLFFSENLSSQMQAVFKDRMIKHGKIMVDGRELKDEDLAIVGPLVTKITFTYGEAEKQTITLILMITGKIK